MPTTGFNHLIQYRLSDRTLRLASLVGGVLTGLSFPPFGWSAFAWFSAAPIFIAVTKSGARNAFICAWLFYTACFLVAFHWPLTHIRPDTAAISAVAWIAFTMILALPFGLARRITERFPHVSGPWLAGAFVLLLEMFLRLGPVPMPWSSVSNSQFAFESIVMATRYAGAEGIGFAIVMANVMIAKGLMGHSNRPVAFLFAGLLIPIGISIFGTTVSTGTSDDYLRIAVLQPGIPAELWADVHDETRVDTLLAISSAMLDTMSLKPDLLVWPETALPVSRMDTNTASMEKLRMWVQDRSISILTGIIIDISDNPSQKKVYQNGAILVQPNGRIQSVSKNILVPFAEHVPLSGTLQALKFLAVPAGGVSGYKPGSEPAVVHLDGVDIGIMICFESAFSDYASKLTTRGSQVLIVMTQNGWWRGPAPAIQHIQIARLRAVEQGRSVVHVNVDRKSGVVGSDGRIVGKATATGRASFVADVPLFRTRSQYLRFGKFVFPIALGIWLLTVGLYGLLIMKKVSVNTGCDRK